MDWLLGDGKSSAGNSMEHADAVSNFVSWNFQHDIWFLAAVSRAAAFETGTFFDFTVHGICVCYGLLGSVPGEQLNLQELAGCILMFAALILAGKNNNDKIGNLQDKHMNGEIDN